MPAPRKYPNELRERAKRLVDEAREQEPGLSMNAAVKRIGPRVGVNAETLRGWVKRADIDGGRRPGVTTNEAAKIRQLEREVQRAGAGQRKRGCSSARPLGSLPIA